MKDNTKITLTIKQLKKLVNESKTNIKYSLLTEDYSGDLISDLLWLFDDITGDPKTYKKYEDACKKIFKLPGLILIYPKILKKYLKDGNGRTYNDLMRWAKDDPISATYLDFYRAGESYTDSEELDKYCSIHLFYEDMEFIVPLTQQVLEYIDGIKYNI